jgi:hypothetical protein
MPPAQDSRQSQFNNILFAYQYLSDVGLNPGGGLGQPLNCFRVLHDSALRF